jgi:hypothetical protein
METVAYKAVLVAAYACFATGVIGMMLAFAKAYRTRETRYGVSLSYWDEVSRGWLKYSDVFWMDEFKVPRRLASFGMAGWFIGLGVLAFLR